MRISTFTPTISETTEPAYTHYATFAPDESRRIVVDLLKGDYCALPCWWGFVPGFTKWQEVEQFLSPLAVSISPPTEKYHYGSVVLPVPEEIAEKGIISQRYIVKNGILQMIYTEIGNIQEYSLSSILIELGMPSEIRINKLTFYTAGWWAVKWIDYDLFYPEKGVLVTLNASAEIKEETIIGCPEGQSYASLIIWLPDDRTYFDILNNRDLFTGAHDNSPENFPNLDELTNMTVSEFYETYINPKANDCFTTDKNNWLFP